jgi:hypothetical protein
VRRRSPRADRLLPLVRRHQDTRDDLLGSVGVCGSCVLSVRICSDFELENAGNDRLLGVCRDQDPTAKRGRATHQVSRRN